MTDTAKEFAAALLESGLTYKAEFVPQSQSRNADETDDRGNPVHSINWRVTIAREGRGAALSLTTDYMQGIGHKPGFAVPYGRVTLDIAEHLTDASERGRYHRTRQRVGTGRPIPAPEFADVLACLVMDCDVLNYVNFEDWAECLGFDTDSRRAEGIYTACVEIALKLRHMIDLDAAAEAFADY